MFPEWITKLFAHNECPECRKLVKVDDISAMGLTRPDQFHKYSIEPIALILAKCPHCQNNIRYTINCPVALITEAIEELYKVVEAKRATQPPPPFSPGSVIVADPNSSSETASKQPVRPSLRPGQVMTTPSPQEIQTFLAEVNQMSFKVNSRTFKNFTRGPRRRK